MRQRILIAALLLGAAGLAPPAAGGENAAAEAREALNEALRADREFAERSRPRGGGLQITPGISFGVGDTAPGNTGDRLERRLNPDQRQPTVKYE